MLVECKEENIGQEGDGSKDDKDAQELSRADIDCHNAQDCKRGSRVASFHDRHEQREEEAEEEGNDQQLGGTTREWLSCACMLEHLDAKWNLAGRYRLPVPRTTV